MLQDPNRFLFVFFGIETAFQTCARVGIQVRLFQVCIGRRLQQLAENYL
jgi:hypothetical protein